MPQMTGGTSSARGIDLILGRRIFRKAENPEYLTSSQAAATRGHIQPSSPSFVGDPFSFLICPDFVHWNQFAKATFFFSRFQTDFALYPIFRKFGACHHQPTEIPTTRKVRACHHQQSEETLGF